VVSLKYETAENIAECYAMKTRERINQDAFYNSPVDPNLGGSKFSVAA